MFDTLLLQFNTMSYKYSTPFIGEDDDSYIYSPIQYNECYRLNELQQTTMRNGSYEDQMSLQRIINNMYQNLVKPTIYNKYSNIFMFHNIFFRIVKNEAGLIRDVIIVADLMRYDLIETFIFQLRDLINRVGDGSKIEIGFDRVVNISINVTPFKNK